MTVLLNNIPFNRKRIYSLGFTHIFIIFIIFLYIAFNSPSTAPHKIALILLISLLMYHGGYILLWPKNLNIKYLILSQVILDCVALGVILFLVGDRFFEFGLLYTLIIYYFGRIFGGKIGFALAVFGSISLGLVYFLQSILPVPWGFLNVLSWDTILQRILTLLIISCLSLSLVYAGRKEKDALTKQLRENEEALFASDSMRFQLLDLLHQFVCVINYNGFITLANKSMLEWAKRNELKPIIGAQVNEVLAGFGFCPSLLELNIVLLKRIIIKDRTYSVHISKLPDGVNLLAVCYDITETLSLENKLKGKENSAKIGELAAGLVHEIKNPLAGIKAGLQLLQEDNSDEEQTERLRNVIISDIDRLDHLVKEFLVFAKPKIPQKTLINLDDNIQNSLFIFKLRFPEVKIDMDISALSLKWNFDKNQFKQILVNLLLNAFQSKSEDGEHVIKIAGYQTDEFEVLTVTDNGLGLDEKIVNKVFDPFITTKAEGTGLGLSIAQRLAYENNSFIKLENNSVQRGVIASLFYQKYTG